MVDQAEPATSERDLQIQRWLATAYGGRPFEVRTASEDASFRRYFRVGVAGEPSRILMDAPPDREDCAPFVEVAGTLAAAGVHVPDIVRQDLRQGFLLLEDLGEQQYLPGLDERTVAGLYDAALDALLRIQTRADPAALPPYDEALLRREMDLFPDWLLGAHLELSLADADRRLLRSAADVLVANALAQPRVLVHRDYHSRNLMITAARNPGIIDFQDAVHGPLTYDLVSLLRDCYIAWPAGQVDAWVETYRLAALRAGLLSGCPAGQFLEWFDLMGVQRHLKAAGIFARLKHRDGKAGFLADIPRTLDYIVQVGRRRPAVSDLAGFIAARVLPAL